jgi:CubicO group peptidase (beta-lactamase class C family)
MASGQEKDLAVRLGGGGLVSTADDYLKFARMLLGRGQMDGVRFLKPETVEIMTSDRLTAAQRDILMRDEPYRIGQGFGLGVGIDIDANNGRDMGPRRTARMVGRVPLARGFASMRMRT